MSAGRGPMEPGHVRRHHRSLAVEALLARGAATRAELAQSVGVTKATMSAVVADLLDLGLVEERAETAVRPRGRMGRPGVEVALRSERIGALGLEITVDDVAACVVDLTGAVRALRRRRSDNGRARPGTVGARLRRVAVDVLADAEALGIACAGGALAVPGLVDPATRALVVAPNLHWHDVVLGPLAGDLGLELLVDNEANLAAVAELRHGAGRGLRSFVHVSAGAGIGGALVLGGAVVRGTNGFAGELGHLVVDPGGPRCACGAAGCLEAVVARAGDDTATVVDALVVALRAVVHLVDPEAVILGGALAALGDAALAALEDGLRRTTLGGRWHPCAVRRSTLAADAALLGAATTVLDALVADPTAVLAGPEARTA